MTGILLCIVAWATLGALGSEIGRRDLNRYGAGYVPPEPWGDRWWWQGVVYGPFALIAMIFIVFFHRTK